MAEDIEKELDAILAGYKARVRQEKGRAPTDRKTEKAFVEAATDCFTRVIRPALHEMEQALSKRNVAAKVIGEGISARIYIPCPPNSCPEGYGIVGIPYVLATVDCRNHSIHFERNTAGGGAGSGVGDYTAADIDADLVKAKVMTLVQAIYGSS